MSFESYPHSLLGFKLHPHFTVSFMLHPRSLLGDALELFFEILALPASACKVIIWLYQELGVALRMVHQGNYCGLVE